MTPSQIIISEATRTMTAFDSKGRRLTFRQLTALDTLRLFKAAGPILAQNEPWLSMAGMAFAVLDIDSVPVPTPVTEGQIEAVIERLGDEGLAAIAEVMNDNVLNPSSQADVGNLPGTPS